jgi:hypothetical protein
VQVIKNSDSYASQVFCLCRSSLYAKWLISVTRHRLYPLLPNVAMRFLALTGLGRRTVIDLLSRPFLLSRTLLLAAAKYRHPGTLALMPLQLRQHNVCPPLAR